MVVASFVSVSYSITCRFSLAKVQPHLVHQSSFNSPSVSIYVVTSTQDGLASTIQFHFPTMGLVLLQRRPKSPVTFADLSAYANEEDVQIRSTLKNLAALSTERHIEYQHQFSDFSCRFDQVDARLDQVDARFDQVDDRFEQVDARFKQVKARLATLEAQVVNKGATRGWHGLKKVGNPNYFPASVTRFWKLKEDKHCRFHPYTRRGKMLMMI